jgi:hypothetical protein
MENITYTTPSGYTVHLKPFLTFGDKRALERVFAEGMSVDATNGTSQASGKAIYEAQDKAVELMVVKIEMEGKTIDGDQILPAIYAMQDPDGRAIYDKVNELSSPKGEKAGARSAPALPISPHRPRPHSRRLFPDLSP